MAKLTTHVHVVERDEHGALTGRAQSFGPDDDLPDWAIASIGNPDVWDGHPPKNAGSAIPRGATPFPVGGASGELEALRRRIQELEAQASAKSPGDTGGGPKPPPKGGPKATTEVWAAYAAEHQVEVPDGATREQIIQALDAAKVPTE